MVTIPKRKRLRLCALAEAALYAPYAIPLQYRYTQTPRSNPCIKALAKYVSPVNFLLVSFYESAETCLFLLTIPIAICYTSNRTPIIFIIGGYLTMAEVNFQFRERYQQVHKPDRRMDWATPSAFDVEVDSAWTIRIPSEEDIVLYNAAQDLQDYFSVSMGVFVPFGRDAICDKCIEYIIDPSLGKNNYRLIVEPDHIRLIGFDAAAAARAGYLLEDLMNLNEAPFVQIQDTTRNVMFAPRMIHSGYDIDVFPDGYLQNLAHYGFTTLLIYVRSLDEYARFNDIIDRAAQYGLNVYAYSTLFNRVYPEGEEGLKYYDNVYGELFRRCPGFAGIVFVGESAEFPSKDPATTGRLRQDNVGPDGKPIVKGCNPGWWPCNDYHVLIEMIKNVIHKERPDVDVVLWSYNWGFQEEALRLALIDRLPKDISLQATFEMFETVERDGRLAKTVDYALWFEGPGRYFTSEAIRAQENGIRFYAMTNTGGRTWDIGTVPYEPFPYQWLKRYRAMKNAHDEWGLAGIMDSHHYGWAPSFISDFSKWMFDAPETDPDRILRRIAVRDFSEETADTVLEAWRICSDAVADLISTEPDQYGPCRVGPAYPLLLWKRGFVFASPEGQRFGGNKICYPYYNYYIEAPGRLESLFATVKWHTRAGLAFDRGADLLEKVMDRIHPSKRDEALRQINIFRYFAATMRTSVNTKEWYLRRKQLEREDLCDQDKKTVAQEMLDIAAREIENAKKTIPLVQFDSSLGYEPCMGYMCDESHIWDKINATNKAIEEELMPFLK